MKTCDRILLLAENFAVGDYIKLEDLKKYKLDKEVCKLIEKGVLLRVNTGVYTLSSDYEKNSQKRKTKQKYDNKLETLIQKYNLDDIITTKDLRRIGFNSYNIAKLVEDGYLFRNKLGEYILKSKEEICEKKSIQANSKPNAKLQNLYEGVLENAELTTKILKSYGFSTFDITKLVEKGILKRVKKGLYEFLDADGIYNYRNYVNPQKKKKCITKCYELNPKHVMANIKLFKRNIKNGNFKNSLIYLENLYNYSDEVYKNNYNLYLYLLNMIVPLPENLKEIADNLTLEDLLSKNKTNKINKDYDDIIIKIFNKDFSSSTLEKLLAMKSSLKKSILVILIYQINNKDNFKGQNNSIDLKRNIKNNQFKKIQEYLSLKNNRNFLEDNLLIIVDNIIEMLNTCEIPKESYIETISTFNAISHNMFDIALELSDNYCESQGIKKENYHINLLLVKINDLIKLLKLINGKNYDRLYSFLLYNDNNIILKQYLIIISQAICDIMNNVEVPIKDHNFTSQGAIKAHDFEFALNLLDNSNDFLGKNILKKVLNDYIALKNKMSKPAPAISIDLIYNALLNSDTTTAFSLVHEYLISFNLEQYEFFIIELIKLSLLEPELGFTRPIQVLIGLTTGTYQPSFDLYVSYFYQAIEDKNLEVAKIYYDILARFKKMQVLNLNMEPINRSFINLKQEEIKQGR